MIVEVGGHNWSVRALQYDKERRRVYIDPNEKMDYIEYSIVLHFTCETEAEYCFKNYEHNEEVRIDLYDTTAHTDERHLENRMKAKRREGCRVVFEKEKLMGSLASKALSNTDT